MSKRSPRVDGDIKDAPDFARPILRKLRTLFHRASPLPEENIKWITEAKRDETRHKRIATAIEWIAEGKPRNWNYMKKW